ncbi:hypothetical protein ACPCG0_13895 [Propionibacteriaceae bacterium Y1923]|uniref:hypothetical protein n=1 Tax=Aestuariimicrobium sp. Y1814 TaxID=3418742 RepID=UPI003C179804
MTTARSRFVGAALVAPLLVALLLVGCSNDEGQTAEPVVTSAGPSASVAVPESTSATPHPTSSAPSSLPATATSPVATRPTVPAEPNGTPSATGTIPATSALGTASATGTNEDGVPSGTAAFGQPFQFPSGLKVNVTSPTTFTPTSQADVPAGQRYVWVNVTLQNSSSTAIDIGIVGHDASAGGTEATRIYDPANQIVPADENPGQLGPGQVLSYRVGFAQAPGAALRVRTMYGWDGQVVHA